MSYVTGPTGPTGITGTQGLQGYPGKVGPGLGPTGKGFIVGTAKLKIVSLTDSAPITLNIDSTVYNFIGTGDVTVTVPAVSNYYPNPEQSGTHWIFKNNTTWFVTFTFTGSYTGSYTVPIGQSLVLLLTVDANFKRTYTLI
jgi:hypothetical protein